jgi:type IV pilus assembly protein PilM
VEFQLPFSSPVKMFQSEDFLLLVEDVAAILTALLRKVNIQQKKAAFSIPDFSTFFTTFSLPPMSEKEIPSAIEFEARHHIPLPLSEVTFDWQIIDKKETAPGFKLKILLVAVPNKVLNNYQKMANLCQLEIKGMEAEIFGLMRSSVPKIKSQMPVCLVDLGWQSTTVSVVMKNNLVMSHSFDISGTQLSRDLCSQLQISFEEAEKLKKTFGLDPKKEEMFRVLTERIDLLAVEIEKVCQDFYQLEQKDIRDLIVSGGTASLFGLKEYLASRLKKNVEIADPFSNTVYPSSLKDRVKDLGPSFAVAVGVAMMGAEA